MKIVNILGGLGNQMFQYALALSLKEKYPQEEIYIDASCFKGYKLHNGYELKRIFNVDVPEANLRQQMQVYYPLPHYLLHRIGSRILPRRRSMIKENKLMGYDPSVLQRDDSAYYIGYWQTEKYFKNIRSEILRAFAFQEEETEDRNRDLLNELATRVAAGIHVRRGDYTNIPATQGICTENYYRNAIQLLRQKATIDLFVVFSDDIEWSKQSLSKYFGNTRVVYVDWNKGSNSYRDMQLMSKCTHNVIANSSFSWWGAWLNQNKNKIVVCPSRWMNTNGWRDILPDEWIKIPV